MELIDKAKIIEFYQQVKAKAEADAKAINEAQTSALRAQGAVAALQYVLNLDTITDVDPEDVTAEDVANAEAWLSENPNG